jgi:hypothetical protein
MFFGLLAVTVLWHLILRPMNLLYSAVGGAILLFGVHFAESQLLSTNFFTFAMEPGVSLRPLRAALPYLVAFTFYIVIEKVNSPNLQKCLIGVTLGLTLLWANDFAVPTFGIFLLFCTSYFYFSGIKTWRKDSSIVALISLMMWYVVISVITAGYTLNLLKYNFLDVARDQWWYFGPYGSDTRIFQISDLKKLFTKSNFFPITVFFVVLVLALIKKRIEYFLVAAVGLTLFAGGSLASIGGHLGGYFGGFFFWGVVTSIMLTISYFKSIAKSCVCLLTLVLPCYLFRSY